MNIRRGAMGALLMAAALMAAPLRLCAQPAPAKEYQVKAVFLFNFAQFVDWPPEAFAEAQTPLVIGVLGENPFGTFLEETVRGEKVNNHPLVVERYARLEDVKACQILFVNSAEAGRLDGILSGLKGKNILTVSDADNFAQRGGVVQFATEKNKIRLKINTVAAKSAGVTISSKLLKVADLIPPAGN